MRRLRIGSNLERLERVEDFHARFEHTPLARDAGMGTLLREFLALRDHDVLLVNADAARLIRYCLFSLVVPHRVRLVSLDIVLGRPVGARQRLVAAVKRWLMRRVDHFVVYQHDLAGYDAYYGVSPERSTVIPFKVNLWERLAENPPATSDDGYLLFVGRTYRDVPTFVRATERSGVPAMIVRHSAAHAREHGTDVFDALPRPTNLRETVNDGGRDSWLEPILRSRAIVLPIQRDVICCAGISTVLDAMALGKPVIISHCPATEGFLEEGDAALVPAGDVDALADAMRRVHDDAAYRDALVRRGRQVAERVQGEARLYRDVLAIVERLVRGAPAAVPADAEAPALTPAR